MPGDLLDVVQHDPAQIVLGVAGAGTRGVQICVCDDAPGLGDLVSVVAEPVQHRIALADLEVCDVALRPDLGPLTGEGPAGEYDLEPPALPQRAMLEHTEQRHRA